MHSLVNTGNGTDIDVTGANFTSLTNTGTGDAADPLTIDVTGADFTSLTNAGAGAEIDVTGADFNSLTNTSSAADSAITIDVTGADFSFSTLTNFAPGAAIKVVDKSGVSEFAGADFGSLVNSGDGAHHRRQRG